MPVEHSPKPTPMGAGILPEAYSEAPNSPTSLREPNFGDNNMVRTTKTSLAARLAADEYASETEAIEQGRKRIRRRMGLESEILAGTPNVKVPSHDVREITDNLSPLNTDDDANAPLSTGTVIQQTQDVLRQTIARKLRHKRAAYELNTYTDLIREDIIPNLYKFSTTDLGGYLTEFTNCLDAFDEITSEIEQANRLQGTPVNSIHDEYMNDRQRAVDLQHQLLERVQNRKKASTPSRTIQSPTSMRDNLLRGVVRHQRYHPRDANTNPEYASGLPEVYTGRGDMPKKDVDLPASAVMTFLKSLDQKVEALANSMEASRGDIPPRDERIARNVIFEPPGTGRSSNARIGESLYEVENTGKVKVGDSFFNPAPPKEALYPSIKMGLHDIEDFYSAKFPPAWVLPSRHVRDACEQCDPEKLIKQRTLYTFNGRVEEYPAWRDAIYRFVHIQDISCFRKYLTIRKLLKPYIMVRTYHGLHNSLTGYIKVLTRLEEKYGGYHRQTDALLEQIRAIKPVRQGDLKSMEAFTTVWEGYLGALASMGHPVIDSNRSLLAMAKEQLPEKLKLQYLTIIRREGCDDDIHNIVEYMSSMYTILKEVREDPREKREAQGYQPRRPERARLYYGEDDNSSEADSESENPQPTRKTSSGKVLETKALEAKSARKSSNEGRCKLCNASHALPQCSNFKKKSVEDRVKFLYDNQYCYRCLKSGHFLTECTSRLACSKCKGRHHTLIHKERPAPKAKRSRKAKANVVFCGFSTEGETSDDDDHVDVQLSAATPEGESAHNLSNELHSSSNEASKSD